MTTPRLPLLLFLPLLLATACKKDSTTKLTLRTSCQHCEVRWNTGGEDQVHDTWFINEFDVIADEGEVVNVSINWRSYPNDTVFNDNGTVQSVTYWDSIPHSLSAWLYQDIHQPIKSGGGNYPESPSFSFSASVPED